jgi:hypothetical protein
MPATKIVRQRTEGAREYPIVLTADEIFVSIAEYRPIYVNGDVGSLALKLTAPSTRAGNHSKFNRAAICQPTSGASEASGRESFTRMNQRRPPKSNWIPFGLAVFRLRSFSPNANSAEFCAGK